MPKQPPPDALTQIRNKLKHCTLASQPRLWLQTGIPELNRVIGHSVTGIPYGRMMEISGLESKGKTAIALALAAFAQHDGAHIVWDDFETSFAADWAIQRGLAACPTCKGIGRIKPDNKHCPDCVDGGEACVACEGTGKRSGKNCKDCLGSGETASLGMDKNRFTLIRPYVGTFGKEKEPRLASGPELLQESEDVIHLMSKKYDRLMLVVDSLPAIMSEGESVISIDEANMRTNMDLPMLLGRVLRRWVGLAMAKNVSIVMINQLREKPNAPKFSSPWYTPGGNAPRFYCHVRIRVSGVWPSKIMQDGKFVGIKGIMKATKNKVGGVEGESVGFRLLFKGAIEFVPASEVLRKEEGAEEAE